MYAKTHAANLLSKMAKGEMSDVAFVRRPAIVKETIVKLKKSSPLDCDILKKCRNENVDAKGVRGIPGN